MLPLNEFNKLLPKRGKIIELGCGDGFISTYLSKIKTRNVTGVDLDKKRLPKSTKRNLKFNCHDIRNYDLSSSAGIILSDVLHHLTYKDQKKLLKKIAKSMKKNSILLIKEIDTGEFLRSKFSRLWDFIFYPKDKIYYHNAKDLKTYLEQLNFEVYVSRPTRIYPASTTLFKCQKNF